MIPSPDIDHRPSPPNRDPERPSACRVPYVDLDSDAQTFSVNAGAGQRLRQSGVPPVQAQRCHRLVDQRRQPGHDRWFADCGPFRAASDFEPGQEPPQYSCTLAVALDHPEAESAQYDIDVSYPGAGAERVDRVFTFCTSDGETATCEQ